MIEIITLILCGANAAHKISVSLILLLLFTRKGIGSGQGSNSDMGGKVYCPECYQPYSANLKICPKCGHPRK